MRIEKREKVILSQDELYTWTDFENILLELVKETQNPNTGKKRSQKFKIFLMIYGKRWK